MNRNKQSVKASENADTQELQRELDSYLKQIADAKKQTDFIKDRSAELVELEEEFSKVRSLQAEFLKENKKEIEELNSKKENLKKDLSILESDISKSQSEFNILENDIVGIKEQKEREIFLTKTQILDLTREINILESNIKVFEVTLQEVKKDISKAEQIKDEISKLELEKNKINSEISNINSVKENLIKECSALEIEVSKQNKSMTDAVKARQIVESQILAKESAFEDRCNKREFIIDEKESIISIKEKTIKDLLALIAKAKQELEVIAGRPLTKINIPEYGKGE